MTWLSLIVIIVYLWLIYYLVKLEQTGCVCALTWHRNYILFYLVFVILLDIIMVVFKNSISDFKLNGPMVAILFISMIALVVASIIFLVTLIKYVKYLKEEKCKCSEGYARDVLDWLPWVIIGLWVAGFILQILIIVFGLYHLPGVESLKSIKRYTKRR